jgi:hypothetical protein
MKQKFTLCISVTLNLALAAGMTFWLRKPTSTAPHATSSPAAAAVTNAESAGTPAASPPARTGFHWSQVMSDDLKVYRDNLLAIGCPRPTVRDIIKGEINERFAPRRQALLNDVESRFWDCVLRGGEQAVREEAVTPFLTMKTEREQMICDLLGEGFGAAEAAERMERENFQSRFSWLPPDKRDRLYALEQKRLQELKDWTKTAPEFANRELTPEESRRLQAIRKEFEDGRNDLLTPDEQEEFRLQQSNESLWAADLSGFEATKEEWTAVTRLRKETEEARLKLLYSDLSDDERQTASAKLNEVLGESLRKLLGAERYAEYARAGDDQFQGIYKVTQRYGLAESVAVQAYELQQSAMAQADKVRNDPGLAADARQKTLSALQQDTEQELVKTLGPTVLSTFKEYGGDWLDKLSQGADQ